NNDFRNGGPAIKEHGGTPAPAWKSVGNIGTASDIASNKGTVFTPPYTLSLKLGASEVEAKVRPSAGNTLSLDGVTRIAKAVPAAIRKTGKERRAGVFSVRSRTIDSEGRSRQ
ncbi:MAG: hypothetical protein ABIW76_06100, partial [Fibrobacteria bacterium]